MTERICYKFEEFLLDPGRRSLLQEGQATPLRPTAFDLLLVLVENHGQTLTKSEITKRVWGSDSGDDRKFHVTLHAVRQRLGDSAQTPRFIARDANGYRFVADVEEIARVRDPSPDVTNPTLTSALAPNIVDPDKSGKLNPSFPVGRESRITIADDPLVFTQRGSGLKPGGSAGLPRSENTQDISLPSQHLWPVFVSCFVYAALYVVALVLEISYEFDRFGTSALKIAPLVLCWMTLTSFAGLTADRKLTSQGKASGLAASTAAFLIAAAVLLAALSRFLPSSPVTQSVLQGYPAQAAYLKDMVYFLILGFCFLIVPFHFIVTVELDVARGRHHQVFGLLTGNRQSSSSRGAIYPRFWALASLLVVLAACSLVMTSRLLDHLKPATYTNLFVQLVYLRAFLYFGLGIWCLIWYYQAIEEFRNITRVERASRHTTRHGRSASLTMPSKVPSSQESSTVDE
jgi:DNA-binding winged helix-turn-helix (wHTH) protein